MSGIEFQDTAELSVPPGNHSFIHSFLFRGMRKDVVNKENEPFLLLEMEAGSKADWSRSRYVREEEELELDDS